MATRFCARCGADVEDVGGFCLLGHRLATEAGMPSLGDLRAQVDKAFERFKTLADRKIRIADVDLEAIVVEEIAAAADEYELVSIQVAGGTHLSPTATVRLKRGDDVIDESAIGDGMIDAACGAIQRATGMEAQLESFSVSSVTGGIDALGDVTIVLATSAEPVRRAIGRGVSTDVVEASARAYLSAVNRLVHLTAREPVTA